MIVWRIQTCNAFQGILIATIKIPFASGQQHCFGSCNNGSRDEQTSIDRTAIINVFEISTVGVLSTSQEAAIWFAFFSNINKLSLGYVIWILKMRLISTSYLQIFAIFELNQNTPLNTPVPPKPLGF